MKSQLRHQLSGCHAIAAVLVLSALQKWVWKKNWVENKIIQTSSQKYIIRFKNSVETYSWPKRFGNIGSGTCWTFLTAIFKRWANGCRCHTLSISAWMNKVIVFATTFADQTREVHVFRNIFAHLTPQTCECSRKKKIPKYYGFKKKKKSKISLKRFTYGTDPVKLMPAKCGEAVIVSPNTGPSAGTKLTTPAGTPASRIILNMIQFDRMAVSDGFHRTELP